MVQAVRNIVEAIFDADKFFDDVKTLGLQIVREAAEDVLEGLNDDDTILPSWGEKDVLERLLYIIQQIMLRKFNMTVDYAVYPATDDGDMDDDGDDDDDYDDSGY